MPGIALSEILAIPPGLTAGFFVWWPGLNRQTVATSVPALSMVSSVLIVSRAYRHVVFRNGVPVFETRRDRPPVELTAWQTGGRIAAWAKRNDRVAPSAGRPSRSRCLRAAKVRARSNAWIASALIPSKRLKPWPGSRASSSRRNKAAATGGLFHFGKPAPAFPDHAEGADLRVPTEPVANP